MAIWLRRAELGWGRSGSKHLMHHATQDRMPEAVREAPKPTVSAHQRGDPVGIEIGPVWKVSVTG